MLAEDKRHLLYEPTTARLLVQSERTKSIRIKFPHPPGGWWIPIDFFDQTTNTHTHKRKRRARLKKNNRKKSSFAREALSLSLSLSLSYTLRISVWRKQKAMLRFYFYVREEEEEEEEKSSLIETLNVKTFPLARACIKNTLHSRPHTRARWRRKKTKRQSSRRTPAVVIITVAINRSIRWWCTL